MNHDYVAGAIAMWMRVFLGGPAVGGPTRVADPIRPVDWIYADCLFQVAQLAGCAADGQMIIAIEDGDPSGIVTAIFKAPETVEDDGDGFSIPDVADYAAHGFRIAMAEHEEDEEYKGYEKH